MTHPRPGGTYHVQDLKRLLNATVIAVGQDDEGYLFIVFEDGDIEHSLTLCSDDEGNHPGSFSLESYDADKEADPYPIPF